MPEGKREEKLSKETTIIRILIGVAMVVVPLLIILMISNLR